jgi:hypothetical protein
MSIKLRDYFAAKAMQAILSNSELITAIKSNSDEANISSDEYLSKKAYKIADTMIKERKK